MNSRQLTIPSYGIASVLTGLCYLGSVRSSAVWLYILPAIGIATLATFAPRKPTPLTCLLIGLISGMVWAVIVNNLSGDNLGPVARSTTVCVAGTTLVVTGLRRGDPNTSLIGQLLSLSGALFYGAANEVWKLALASMVFQLAGYYGESQAAQKRQPRSFSWRSSFLLFLLPLAGATIIFATPWDLPEILKRTNPRQSVILGITDIQPPRNSQKITSTTLVNKSPTKSTLPIQNAPQIDEQLVDWSLVLKIIWFVL